MHWKSTRQLHVRVRAVHGRVDGRCAAAYGPCTRVTCRVSITRRTCTRPVNTSSPAKTARTRPYNGHAVYTARTRPCMARARRAHGPSTPPVYMTVYGPSARTSSAVYIVRTRGRVHGRVRAVHTGRTHDTYTAAYTCLRVHGRIWAIYTVENGRLHGRVTCRVYGRVWADVDGPCICLTFTRPVHGDNSA